MQRETIYKIGISLLISIIVWAISRYLIPVLPPELSFNLIFFFAVFVIVVAVLSNISQFSLNSLFHISEDMEEKEKAIKTISPQLPNLKLQLFRMDDRRYQDEISFDQSSDAFRIRPSRFPFGISLENTAESTIAQGIDIRVEIAWRGNNLQYAPKFEIHRRMVDWKAEHNFITFDRSDQEISVLMAAKPAVLTFHGTEKDRCPFGQPLEWYNFSIILQERVQGYFLVQYQISSVAPPTHNNGELRIIMI